MVSVSMKTAPLQHLDLVGAFKSDMRETDDEAMRRAHCIVVDEREAALTEGGDVVLALASGAIGPDKIAGDLRDLVLGNIKGRSSDDDITVFKSVGFALEDLAAAKAVYDGELHGAPAGRSAATEH